MLGSGSNTVSDKLSRPSLPKLNAFLGQDLRIELLPLVEFEQHPGQADNQGIVRGGAHEMLGLLFFVTIIQTCNDRSCRFCLDDGIFSRIRTFFKSLPAHGITPRMQIDQQTVPPVVLQVWKASLGRADQAAIKTLAAQDRRLTAGFRPGKLDPVVARKRLQAALDQQDLPEPYRDLLRDTTLANSLVRVLSEDALTMARQALCRHYGDAELAAAMLLDAREAVRRQGFEWLQTPVAAESATDLQAATRELTDLFQPFLAQIQAWRTASPEAQQPSPATAAANESSEGRAPRSTKERELLLALREKDKDAKRWRREYQAAHEERLRLRQAVESAQATQASAQARLTELTQQLAQWETRFDHRVAERVDALLDARLLPWLRPAEQLEQSVQQSRTASWLEQAQALLERQAAQDRRYGLRSRLESELQACQAMQLKLEQAQRDALRPLPELATMAAGIAEQMRALSRQLGESATTTPAAHPGLQRLARSLQGATTLDQVGAVRQALQASATLGWLDETELAQAYQLIGQASSRCYALAGVTQGWSQGRLVLQGLPLHALQAELAQGRPCTVVVDGHNMLYTQPGLFREWFENGQPGQRARQRLIDQLLALLERQPGLQAHLWFDGDTLHDYTPAPRLRVHYSGGIGADRADQRIVAYLHHLRQSTPTQLRAVVTADRSEARQAEQTGALVLAPQELGLWLR